FEKRERERPIYLVVETVFLDHTEISRRVLGKRDRGITKSSASSRIQKVIHEPLIRFILRCIRQGHYPIHLGIRQERQLMMTMQLVIQDLTVGEMDLPPFKRCLSALDNRIGSVP